MDETNHLMATQARHLERSDENSKPSSSLKCTRLKMEEENKNKNQSRKKSFERARRLFWMAPKNCFCEFCGKTSLHGMQYLGEDNLSLVERFFWFTAILLGVGLCSIYIKKQWDKWQTSPVIITFDENYSPVWEVPFPAVTICPELKFMQRDFNYTHLNEKLVALNVTEQEKKWLKYAASICPFGNYKEGKNVVDNGLIEFLFNISPPVERILRACRWGPNYEKCTDLFYPIVTDDGVCYTFNTIAPKEMFRDDVVLWNTSEAWPSMERPATFWSLDEGYHDTYLNSNDAYPRHAVSAGSQSGLSMFVDALDEDVDAKCRIPWKGFKMMLHNPATFPQVCEKFFRIPSRRSVLINVHPRIITTTNNLKDYSPEERKCFFENEHRLRFFRKYTQENCEVECVTNATLAQCMCVSYYMPKDSNIPICGQQMRNCTELVIENYNYHMQQHDSCNCLPACNEIKYDIELSAAGFMWEKVRSDLENARFGTIDVVLKDMQIITRKRSELFGATDFLANCGGLLGLFLGFSLLSLIEIFYFVSLRLYYNFRALR